MFQKNQVDFFQFFAQAFVLLFQILFFSFHTAVLFQHVIQIVLKHLGFFPSFVPLVSHLKPIINTGVHYGRVVVSRHYFAPFLAPVGRTVGPPAHGLLHLRRSRPGLVQFALTHGFPSVPIGRCNRRGSSGCSNDTVRLRRGHVRRMIFQTC